MNSLSIALIAITLISYVNFRTPALKLAFQVLPVAEAPNT